MPREATKEEAAKTAAPLIIIDPKTALIVTVEKTPGADTIHVLDEATREVRAVVHAIYDDPQKTRLGRIIIVVPPSVNAGVEFDELLLRMRAAFGWDNKVEKGRAELIVGETFDEDWGTLVFGSF